MSKTNMGTWNDCRDTTFKVTIAPAVATAAPSKTIHSD